MARRAFHGAIRTRFTHHFILMVALCTLEIVNWHVVLSLTWQIKSEIITDVSQLVNLFKCLEAENQMLNLPIFSHHAFKQNRPLIDRLILAALGSRCLPKWCGLIQSLLRQSHHLFARPDTMLQETWVSLKASDHALYEQHESAACS